jgi:hypothetical protein
MNTQRALTLCLIIAAAAASRLLPHPENVTPVAALALFAGAHFERRSLALLVPLAAMLLSDMVLGFHATQWAVYLGVALMCCIGFLLRTRRGAAPVALACLAGSVVFFVVSNVGVWLTGGLYAPTLEGLVACFVAAIPFFTNTLLGDAFYAALLFGGFALAERRYGWLAPRASVC